MKVICQNCQNKFDYHMYVGLCPKCGKIYRTRSEVVEHNTGIVLNATYSTEDIHPEQEEYFNHTHSVDGSYIPGNITHTSDAHFYPDKNYEKTQLNKAYRPPQMINRVAQSQPDKKTSKAAFIIVFIWVILFLLGMILSLIGG